MKHCQIFYNSKNKIHLYIIAAGLCIVALLLSLLLGSTRLTFSQLIQALFEGDQCGTHGNIFWYVRLPRTLGCLVTGAALAVAGAMIQGVLANKLASPSIIGVNSGAGLAVTICTVLGIYSGLWISLWSFVGAFLAVMVIAFGAKKWGASRGTVILTGVALNSLLNAISQAIIVMNPQVGVMSSDFKIGDFSAVTYSRLLPAGIIILLVLGVAFTLSNELEIMTMGAENAQGLGVNVKWMRIIFLLLSALLAGCAVSLAGLLSFVGLLIPHAVRKMMGTGGKGLLPLCALFGAGFVTLCDMVSRVIFAPYEVPVGIIMSFLGAPFFIILLIRRRGGHARD